MVNICVIAKATFASILSLVLLLTPISANFCLATEPVTGTDMDLGSNYTENQSGHPDHQQTPCDNKLPHQNNHLCCDLAPEGKISYVSLLDSCPLNPSELLFKPLEVVKSFYRPPQIQS